MAREQATHSYRVDSAENGHYVVDRAERVAGPFASNAEAWAWADRHSAVPRYGAR
jgi:hypothetical protein